MQPFASGGFSHDPPRSGSLRQVVFRMIPLSQALVNERRYFRMIPLAQDYRKRTEVVVHLFTLVAVIPLAQVSHTRNDVLRHLYIHYPLNSGSVENPR